MSDEPVVKPESPPDVTLTAEGLVRLLGHRSFYRSCPAFFFMKDKGLAAYQICAAAAAGKAAEVPAALKDPACAWCKNALRDPLSWAQAVISEAALMIENLYKDDPSLCLSLYETVTKLVGREIGVLRVPIIAGDGKKRKILEISLRDPTPWDDIPFEELDENSPNVWRIQNEEKDEPTDQPADPPAEAEDTTEEEPDSEDG